MKWLLRFIVVLISLVLSAFCAMVFLIYHTAAQDTSSNAEAIVVLGAAQYDGTPSPVFQSRLDHALELFNAHRAPLIIVSGGKQVGDTYSEAVSGKKYLSSKGVPAESILIDENSYSTIHSLARVKEIAIEKGLSHLIIVSDPFHMYRALLIAEGLGLNAVGSPTRTSPIAQKKWVELEYVMREAFLSYAYIIFDV